MATVAGRGWTACALACLIGGVLFSTPLASGTNIRTGHCALYTGSSTARVYHGNLQRLPSRLFRPKRIDAGVGRVLYTKVRNDETPQGTWDDFVGGKNKDITEQDKATGFEMHALHALEQAQNQISYLGAEKDHSKVSIIELLSASIDANLEASERIRTIYRSNNLFEREREDSKVGGGMVTLCDLEAQRTIMEAVKEVFPLVRCVGQEGELDDIAFEGEGAKATAESLRRELSGEDVFDGLFDREYVPSTQLLAAYDDEFPDELKNIDAKDITVWIDPIDGSEAMLEGFKEVVCSMVGISVKGKPVAGVVVMPFERRMIWGLVGVGVGGDVDKADSSTTFKPIFVAGVSRSGERAITDAVEDFNLPRTLVVRHLDVGNMMVKVLEGQMDKCIFMRRSTKWTSCAVEAILTAANGKLTDLEGNRIEYDADGSVVNENLAVSMARMAHPQTVKLGKFFKNLV
ncbi:hypothetical protein AAMO2058_000075100 [Amorphochlora amoebiformis]